jgi:Protein of unknown function (DUF2752)
VSLPQENARASTAARALMFAGTLAVLFYARYIGTHRVEFEFTVCTLRRVAHIPCPFCFMTRAWATAASGDIVQAFLISPLGTVLFFSTIAAALWLIAALIFRFPALPIVRWSRKSPVWIAASLALLANWAYNLWRWYS